MKRFFSILLLVLCSLSYATERQYKLALSLFVTEPEKYTQKERDHIDVVNNIKNLFVGKYKVLQDDLSDAQKVYINVLYKLFGRFDFKKEAKEGCKFPIQFLSPYAYDFEESLDITEEQCLEVGNDWGNGIFNNYGCFKKMALDNKGLNGIIQKLFDVTVFEKAEEIRGCIDGDKEYLKAMFVKKKFRKRYFEDKYARAILIKEGMIKAKKENSE